MKFPNIQFKLPSLNLKLKKSSTTAKSVNDAVVDDFMDEEKPKFSFTSLLLSNPFKYTVFVLSFFQIITVEYFILVSDKTMIKEGLGILNVLVFGFLLIHYIKDLIIFDPKELVKKERLWTGIGITCLFIVILFSDLTYHWFFPSQ
jgi:hypothetical protein